MSGVTCAWHIVLCTFYSADEIISTMHWVVAACWYLLPPPSPTFSWGALTAHGPNVLSNAHTHYSHRTMHCCLAEYISNILDIRAHTSINYMVSFSLFAALRTCMSCSIAAPWESFSFMLKITVKLSTLCNCKIKDSSWHFQWIFTLIVCVGIN